MPDVKKYLNRDGLEDYNSLLPHSAGAMQEYVDAWLAAHPEATTTVQDGSVTAQKLAAKSVTRAKLADDVTNLLAGMMLTGEAQGEPITVSDAWSIEPLTLTIEGKSTQAGTPSPQTPIPIVDYEALAVSIHASADGTTDYGNWPISVPLGQYVLRSLPNGTCDTVTLTYLQPSTRAGWSIYARELVQRVQQVTFDEAENWRGPYNYASGAGYYTTTKLQDLGYKSMGFKRCNLASEGTGGGSGVNTFYFGGAREVNFVGVATLAPTIADWRAIVAATPAVVLYNLANPIITPLDPIELPTLPAPTCILWADPSTGLKMSYMRNSNIVISDIEQTIADL